jgi:hypothetical protein
MTGAVIVVWHPLKMKWEVSLFLVSFHAVSCSAFSRVPFESCMLSNDTSRPAFNAILHEYHAQTVGSKLSRFYNMLNISTAKR